MGNDNRDLAVDAMIEGLRRARVRLVEGDGPSAGQPLGAHSFRQVLGEVLMVGSVHLHAPEEVLDGELLATVRQCRICGCTDEEACPGGCTWSQPEICSTCARRQLLIDEQYFATSRAQQAAAEFAGELAATQSDVLGKIAAMLDRLADEQTEVAKMQRENLAGATWRLAVDCAARDAGSPTETDGAHDRIAADAEWYAHLLGNPPVVF